MPRCWLFSSSTFAGIFSANADGKGVAAAQVIRVGADGSETVVPVFRCGSAAGSCVADPFDLGTDVDQVYLVLYATGVHWFTSIQNVTCTIGGLPATVIYAGPQNTIDGLDQINLLVPRALAGHGLIDVVVSVDGQLTNTVSINIQ